MTLAEISSENLNKVEEGNGIPGVGDEGRRKEGCVTLIRLFQEIFKKYENRNSGTKFVGKQRPTKTRKKNLVSVFT